MTLAPNTTKPSPESSSVTPTQYGENTHAEPLLPMLLRLPRLHSTIATEPTSSPSQTLARESTHPVAADEPVGKLVDTEPSCASSPQPNAVTDELPPASARPSLRERSRLRDLNFAAWVDRLATRKTLSIALVVVVTLAIWMPRSSDLQNTTASLPRAGANSAGARASIPLAESRDGESDPLAANAALPSQREPATADSSVEHAPRQSHFKPEFSVAAVPMMSPAIEPVSHQTTDDSRESAAYVMDPLASEANEQIRRMDATYADLPSVAAMDAAAMKSTAPPIASGDDASLLRSDGGERTGMLNLVKSRTPNPINNWAEYLPPAGAQDLAGQTVSRTSASPHESSTASQTATVKNDINSVRTTDSPVAPDFGFALPGGEELIDADAQVAMPRRDSGENVNMR